MENNKSRQSEFKALAEQCVRSGDWDKAAQAFSRSGVPFEEAALSLLGHGMRLPAAELLKNYNALSAGSTTTATTAKSLSPLKTFLSEVLLNLPLTAKSQRTMLCTWMCELFLHEISAAQLANHAENERSATQECMAFMRSNRAALDVSTVLELLSSRNQRAMLLFFVKIMGDYYRATCVLMSEKRFQEALSVLSDAPIEKVSSFLYKVTPLLVNVEPEKTFHLLSTKTSGSFTPCLPTLLHYTRSVASNTPSTTVSSFELIPLFHAIRFLEDVLASSGVSLDHAAALDDDDRVRDCIDADAWEARPAEAIVLHTYVSLLAQNASSHGVEYKLVNVFKVLDTLGANGLTVAGLDAHFLLRQCRLHSCATACVYALLLANDRVQAVREAMVIDVLLAKQFASRAESHDERRALWLEIAQHVVTREDDMKKAVTLIRDSKNALTIEDLLPLLPDFTEIDFFKDEICKSLEDCSSSINGIKLEMQQLADDVDSTVKELESMKNRAFSVAYGNQKCDLCSENLHTHQFFLFPCAHGFHAHCLIESAKQSLSPAKVTELQRVQDSMNAMQRVTSQQETRLRASQQEQLQQQLEGLIASDCPLCGYAIIQKISRSLLDETSSEEKTSWQL